MSTDMALSIMDGLNAYLLAALSPGLRVVEGWPEGDALKLDLGPVLSVTPTGRPAMTPHPPYVLQDVPTDGETTQVISWAQGTQAITLQLFAGYKAQREEQAPLVTASLNNQGPWGAGLILPIDFHGMEARFSMERIQQQDGPQAQGLGEWRALWLLHTEVHAVQVKTWAKQGPSQPTLTWDIN